MSREILTWNGEWHFVKLGNMIQVFMEFEPERALNFRFRSYNIRSPKELE